MKTIKMTDEFVSKNKNLLDDKKEQTTYKIKYVSQYVENWLYVVTNIDQVKNINFIDCMCNAGVYSDGETGTSIKVLELFNEFAPQHPDKNFYLILNDINADRIKIILDVISNVVVASSNIHIVTNNADVNDFLLNDAFFNKYFNCYPNRSSNVVFVDPYNFCTVKISSLEHFLSKTYCELIFNIFTNDFVRNQDKKKMQEFCKNENIPLCSKDEMVNLITNRLKSGNIKYSFSYEFKIATNTELYQIMFFTPNIRGLEKLKEALWNTFDGKEFHRNGLETDSSQLSFFTDDDEKDWRLQSYSAIAQEMILQKYKGQTVGYLKIEEYVIENTMLNGNHLIENVLKPLISSEKITKLGLVKRSSNFKKDQYQIGGLL